MCVLVLVLVCLRRGEMACDVVGHTGVSELKALGVRVRGFLIWW